MYRVTKKRGGYIVLRKSDRKQVHKNSFRNKTEANNFMNDLLTKEAVQETSKYTFVGAFEAYINRRKEIADNPSIQATRGGVSSLISDFDLRIKPYIKPDLLLSDFNYQTMKEFLITCYKNGHRYKRLKKTVIYIKRFLRECALLELKPNLSTLHFKFSELEEIKPTDHHLKYTTETPVIDEDVLSKMILDLQSKKDDDYKSARRFALIAVLFMFGLRKSELQGLRIECVDLERSILKINGVYLQKEDGFKTRTKNAGSFRDIDLNESAVAFFKWYLPVLKKYKPDTKWLFPARSGVNPISDAHVFDTMWMIYADYGLANICRKNGHVSVISSPLKGAVTKTFRHRLAYLLIEAMNTEFGITANYVKHTLGHTRFTTSQDIYGNHKPKIAKAKTNAKAKVLGYDKLSISL